MNQQLSPIEDFNSTVLRMKEQFQLALPAHIRPERFVRIVQTAVRQNPKLLDCRRDTLFGAAMRAAQDGLLPDGKEAAFVQFKEQVQYMPMIAGILKKVRNSGDLKSINALVIYKNDEFNYWVDGEGEQVKFIPHIFGGDRGEAIGVFAFAQTKDGGLYVEVMSADDVDDIRKVSRSKDNGPWSGPFKYEMWRKSCLRRLSKRLPMSTDLEEVINADDDLFQPEPEQKPEPVSVDQAPKSTRTSKLVQEAMESEEPPIETESSPVEENDIPI